MPTVSSIDPEEIAKFRPLADEWWDPHGRFRPLHRMNPCRLDYIVDQIGAEFCLDTDSPGAFRGLRLLDIGCGGGLLSEPMARLGAAVLGADASDASIAAARVHAEQSGLDIEYRCTTVEELSDSGDAFDAIINMEVIEHVSDPAAYVAACAALLRPGGVLISSTLNRTARSFALAIVGAEYVLGWLPRGTHDWRKFLTPREFGAMCEDAGLTEVDRKGFVYNPLSRSWSVSGSDTSVNYVTTCVLRAQPPPIA